MSYTEGYIDSLCYMVQRGKPAGLVAVLERNLEKTLKLVSSYNLQTYYEELCAGWLILWIYKHDHILDVIKSLPQIPSSNYDHWVLGKLFGYDEISIKEYLKKNTVM